MMTRDEIEKNFDENILPKIYEAQESENYRVMECINSMIKEAQEVAAFEPVLLFFIQNVIRKQPKSFEEVWLCMSDSMDEWIK
jgi:hypothetical protein